jgi:hypothetical protein
MEKRLMEKLLTDKIVRSAITSGGTRTETRKSTLTLLEVRSAAVRITQISHIKIGKTA